MQPFMMYILCLVWPLPCLLPPIRSRGDWGQSWDKEYSLGLPLSEGLLIASGVVGRLLV